MKLRISMRTVLWVVAIVAILAAWMADRYRLNYKINSLNRAKYRRAVQAIEAEKAKVSAAQWEKKYRELKAQAIKRETP